MIISVASGDYQSDKFALGKKFANTIKSQMSQDRINWYRMKIEELKLQIVDAAEQGKRPPKLYDVEWLYILQYSGSDYTFIAQEFGSWITMNGLVSIWQYKLDGSRFLEIRLSSYVNFDEVPDPKNYNVSDILNRTNK
jgi:hypothetical protein